MLWCTILHTGRRTTPSLFKKCEVIDRLLGCKTHLRRLLWHGTKNKKKDKVVTKIILTSQAWSKFRSSVQKTNGVELRLTHVSIIWASRCYRQYSWSLWDQSSYELYLFTLKGRKPWTLKIFLECSLCFDQSRAIPCNRRKRMGYSVTERVWFSICFGKTSKFNLYLNLQEYKLLFLSIWEPHALRERKMLEWSSDCCGCIVATAADCRNRRLLFFNSLVYRFQMWMWHFQNLPQTRRRGMMQARLERKDVSA